MFLTVPSDWLPATYTSPLPLGTRITVDLSPARPAASLRFLVRDNDGADSAFPATVALAGVALRRHS